MSHAQLDEFVEDIKPRFQRRRRRVLVTGPTITRARWEGAVARGLVVSDLVAVSLAVFVSYALWFGDVSVAIVVGQSEFSYVTLGVIVIALWMFALTVERSRDPRVVGAGYKEFQRVFRASFFLFGGLAIAALLLRMNLSRGFLAVVFPLGFSSIVVSRLLWRSWLRRRRAAGELMSKVLVIGGVKSASRIGGQLTGDPSAGYQVVGVWIPDAPSHAARAEIVGREVPVLGTESTLADALTAVGADTVLVTDTEHLGHEGMRDLGWELEGSEVRLLVAPNVIDVAGPRMHMHAAANMPFIHLAEPRYKGASRLGKSVFDRSVAIVALVVLAPVMLATAVAVRLTDGGPVFYRQTRVGQNGQTFLLMKFRSMRVGADAEKASLAVASGGQNGPLFKLASDPRVTRVGRFIRKFSIDELPQFFNVLRGEMSVVGPRPHLPDEVAAYDHRATYRLRVRPGITGLWQVSGRSDLAWEDAVRLDLDYVENWSMFRDMQIVSRTVRAVLRSDGAY